MPPSPSGFRCGYTSKLAPSVRVLTIPNAVRRTQELTPFLILLLIGDPGPSLDLKESYELGDQNQWFGDARPFSQSSNQCRARMDVLLPRIFVAAGNNADDW